MADPTPYACPRDGNRYEAPIRCRRCELTTVYLPREDMEQQDEDTE